MKRSAALLLVLIIAGCYPVSHIIVGEAKEPLSASQVKIYLDYPEVYEKIALLDAGSNFAFQDPAILFTHQSKMDKVMERLKIEAAQLGANGIVIVGTENKIFQSISSDGEGNVRSSKYTEKFGKAVAIHVSEETE
ncbi:MAG: hypothetical protein QGH89_06965 [Candidatus Marinimicrobia bacterium]|jgi:hypothetical protein|nr:hypothetical protein [Candidatus Neomarinimicrobiota bacterium]